MPLKILSLSLLIIFPYTTVAGEFTGGHSHKIFTETQLTINKGDSVKFINQDFFKHNVFSL